MELMTNLFLEDGGKCGSGFHGVIISDKRAAGVPWFCWPCACGLILIPYGIFVYIIVQSYSRTTQYQHRTMVRYCTVNSRSQNVGRCCRLVALRRGRSRSAVRLTVRDPCSYTGDKAD